MLLLASEAFLLPPGASIYFRKDDTGVNELCQIIRNMVLPNFINMETSIRTYDRNADCCGAPAWRFVYHALHSADKWFFNPFEYDEPPFHREGLDNPNTPCDAVLSDEELLDYLAKVRQKTCGYLDGLTDDMLYEKPGNCEYTRMELVLRQFRHLSFHTGMLNGQTAERLGKFPIYVSEESVFPEDGSLFGRYVTKKKS